MIIFKKHMLEKFRGLGYRTSLDNLFSSDFKISLKFDTGASETVISLGALGVVDENKIANVEDYCINKGINSCRFESASKTRFTAYRCYSNNVLIGGVKIEKFWFYLYPVVGKIALLGNDFLDFCSVRKEICSNSYIINAFNYDKYLNFQQSVVLDGDLSSVELMNNICTYNYSKDLARSIRTNGLVETMRSIGDE